MRPTGIEELANTGTSIGAQRPTSVEAPTDEKKLIDTEELVVICYKYKY